MRGGLLFLLLCGLLPRPCLGEPAQSEVALLHRPLDLGGLRRLDRRGGRFVDAPPLPPARIRVLHLWAVECAPCRAELPVLQRVVQAWKSSPEIRFVLVSETRSEADLLAYLRAELQSLPDEELYQAKDSRLRAALDNDVQPLTLLLDEQGVVRQAFIGSIAERTAELAAALRRLSQALRIAPACRRR